MKKQTTKNNMFSIVLGLSLLLTMIQIVLGTQVRQFVDEQVKMGIENKDFWLTNPHLSFYFHRTFSFVVLLANLFLFLRNKRLQLKCDKIGWVMLILFAEVLSGIVMYYYQFPFGSQTIHLVLASVLFGLQFYIVLDYFQVSNKNKVHKAIAD